MSEINPPAPPSRTASRTTAPAHRRGPGVCSILAALLAVAPLAAPNTRAEDSATTTLVLNQDSLGQTRDQILRAEGMPIDTEEVETGTAPEQIQAVSAEALPSAGDDEQWRDAPEAPAGAEVQPPPSPLAVDATSCIEVSVRAGNGLDESTRVCRAIFPD